tara:strand:+ start:3901 stop:4032 length:132 start_codon:yes stop_codon:yes gene_type:complete
MMEIILYLGALGALFNFILQLLWYFEIKRSNSSMAKNNINKGG